MTAEQLKELGTLIKNATDEGVNTADRIGTAIVAGADLLISINTQLANGIALLQNLQYVPKVERVIIADAAELVAVTAPITYIDITTDDVYDVVLPSCEDCEEKLLIIQNSGVNSFTLLPKGDDVVLANAEGVTCLKDITYILYGRNATEWVVIK